MKRIITLGLILIAFSSSAQWTLVKQFNKLLNFIESTQQGIIVSTDSVYYIQKDPSLQTWDKYSVKDKILDMESKDSYLYFITSKNIYEHLTEPIKIHEISGNNSFTKINIFKGEKLVCINDKIFCKFESPFASFDTLGYSSISSKYPLHTAASDDSIAFIGYSNYLGGLIYNETTKQWEGLNPLEREVIYDSYVNNGTIMSRFTKAGTDFYISHDYGKTYSIKSDAFDFNSSTGSILEYSNGNIFIGFNNQFSKGIYQSLNDGQTWTKILSDSSITGLAINENNLFATTAKGSLLKFSFTPIITSMVQNNEKSELGFYYSKGVLYNNTLEKIDFLIYDLTGKQIVSTTVDAKSQTVQGLNQGTYILTQKSKENSERIKINVW